MRGFDGDLVMYRPDDETPLIMLLHGNHLRAWLADPDDFRERTAAWGAAVR